MRIGKRAMVVLVVAGVFFPGVWTFSGNREGNGGDHIRSTFIKVGKAVMQYLRTNDQGMLLSQKHALDLDLLEAGLDIEKITVVDETLIDNGGSDADALGERGKITLRKDRWNDHFENERDIYYLVFHEMLRQVGVNDDNYIISGDVRPFPINDRVVTRIASFVPLISTDSILPFLSLNAKDLILVGSGCRQEDIFLDLDTAKGVLNVAFDAYRAVGTTDRKTCEVRFAVKSNPYRQLVISQVDMSGKVSLPDGASVAVGLRPNLGTSLGTQVRKVMKGKEYGRFHLRTTPNFATSCGSESTIMGLNTNVTLLSPTSDAVAAVDRLAVYFRVEPCDASAMARAR